MNEPDDTHDKQQRFRELARGFDAKDFARAHPLDPFEDDIRHLRQEGATYPQICALLKQAGITVTLGSLSRYCLKHGIKTRRQKSPSKPRQKNEEKPPQSRKRSAARKAPKDDARSDDSSADKEAPQKSPAHTTSKRKGPRIADPKTL